MPRHRLVYDNLFGLQVNPLGIEDQLSVGYRLRLYDDPGLLYRDAFVGLAFTPTLNPAVARVGGTVEIRPLSVLALSAGGYFVRWFGAMGHLQSFPDTSANWSDSAIATGKMRRAITASRAPSSSSERWPSPRPGRWSCATI